MNTYLNITSYGEYVNQSRNLSYDKLNPAPEFIVVTDFDENLIEKFLPNLTILLKVNVIRSNCTFSELVCCTK